MAPACGPPASLEPPAGSRGSAERAVLFFSPVSAQSREAASSGPESSGPGSESMAEMERSDGRTRAIRGVPARGTVSCSAQPTATAAETGPLDARVVEANGGVADASREQQEPREGWISSESAGTASRPSGMPKATSFPPEERANTNPQRARTFPPGSRPLALQSGAPVAASKANRLPVSVRARRASPPGESWTTRSPGSSRSHPAVKRKGAGGGSDDAVGYEATRESGRRL